MPDEDLKLNKLSRFSKSSPRLVLREYTHCEVPAGCGGVVFRWKRPDNTVKFDMLVVVQGDFQLLIDGSPPESACPLLPSGDHVLSLIISNLRTPDKLFIFAGRQNYPEESRTEGEAEEENLDNPATREAIFHEGKESDIILSLPDSSWKYCINPPRDDTWTNLDFDDSAWDSLTSTTIPNPQARKPLHDLTTREVDIVSLLVMGARCLGIKEATAKTVWVRKKFTL